MRTSFTDDHRVNLIVNSIGNATLAVAKPVLTALAYFSILTGAETLRAAMWRVAGVATFAALIAWTL